MLKSFTILGLAVLLAVGGACRRSAPPASGGSDRRGDVRAAPQAGVHAEDDSDRPRPPDPTVVGELIVRDLTPDDIRPAELGDALETLVRASLAATPRIVLPADDGVEAEGTYSLGVGVGVALLDGEQPLAKPGKGTLVVALRAELGRHLSGDLPEEYAVDILESRPYDPAADGPLPERARAQARTAMDRARDRLVVLLRAAGDPDERLVGLLADADPFARAAAAREVGERRLASAEDALARLLADPDREVRQAALGALGRLRARGAVAAVAGLTQGMDGVEVRLAVLTLGDIGGPEARRYLETLAFSHPMEPIRRAAEEALRRNSP